MHLAVRSSRLRLVGSWFSFWSPVPSRSFPPSPRLRRLWLMLGLPVRKALRLTDGQIALAPQGNVAGNHPGEHFVVMAGPGIDPQMVHKAPVDIDEEMVIRPADQRAPSPFMIVPPGGQPGLVPVPAPPGSAPAEGDDESGGLLYTPLPSEPR